MKKGLILGSIAAALALSGTAMADGFNYNFIEAGYVNYDDDSNDEGDGFGLRGSVAFSSNFHGFANYSNLDFDSGFDSELFEVGLGYNTSLNPNLDFIGTASYLKNEVDGPGGDDDGFGLSVGLRGRLNERLELKGDVQYTNFDDADDNTSFGIGARYYFTNMFSLGADVRFDGDATLWAIGGRFSFKP